MYSPKLTLTLLLLAIPLGIAQAQTQTQAGRLLLTGNIHYFSNSQTRKPSGTAFNPTLNSKATEQQLGFTPQVGYFLANNLVAGISVDVYSDKQFNSQTNTTNTTPTTVYTATREIKTKGLAIGPFVRYYRMVGDKAGFFAQLTAAHLSSTTITAYTPISTSPSTFEEKETGGVGSLRPGFVFFPTEKLGLELTLGSLTYIASSAKPQNLGIGQSDYETKNSFFTADFGLQALTIGAAFHLGK